MGGCIHKVQELGQMISLKSHFWIVDVSTLVLIALRKLSIMQKQQDLIIFSLL